MYIQTSGKINHVNTIMEWSEVMKALSLRSDYALDVLSGDKTIEYRSWPTKYRGDLLICATAHKIPKTIPGHALVVVRLKDVKKSWVIISMHGNLTTCERLNHSRLKGGNGYLTLMIAWSSTILKSMMKITPVKRLLRRLPKSIWYQYAIDSALGNFATTLIH